MIHLFSTAENFRPNLIPNVRDYTVFWLPFGAQNQKL